MTPPHRRTDTPLDLPQAHRVLITGSRTWTDEATITTALDDLHAHHGDRLRIVHGACPRGADAIAQAWAVRHHVPTEKNPADWSTGRRAGPARNAAMVATSPDQCLAFITGSSPGTAALATAAGIPTTRYTPPTTGPSAEPDPRAATTSARQDDEPAPHRDADTGAPAAETLERQDTEQLIAVLDGPLADQWFTWTDWRARIDAARYIADRTGRRSPVLDYLPAGYQVPNPVLPHTNGWAAVHHPTAQTRPATLTTEAAVTETARADELGNADELADLAQVADERADDDAYDVAG